jgi:hypothetical protein
MKYLCLGYHDEQVWQALPADERQALIDESRAYEERLRRSGHCHSGIALHSAATAATLRFRGGRALVTDGPFAETKEQLGGFMILEASDLNQAIQLMSQVPCMRMGGSLEIRPINQNVYEESPEGVATATV